MFKHIEKNIEKIKNKIERTFKYFEIPIRDVSILCVSKNRTTEEIEYAIENTDLIDFGENRIQRFDEIWKDLKQKHNHVKLHFIGPIQTNKIKYLVNVVDYIHSIDSFKIIDEISKHMVDNPKWNPICFLQINTGGENQKSGIKPIEIKSYLDYAQSKNIVIVGIMCIPPIDEEASIHFGFMNKLAKDNNIELLSMGMSNDYEDGVMLGSNFVRIGRAIFEEQSE